ncbi:hypothetical protein [Histidinibacterium lentulum]|uniref:hypothetical protein n=1 Tax=Histidinibacterium lentulum TaxID=2480588 RepID=UPI000F4CBC82|nr:hypothetical protein [Histidinibacterium lentulum]
MSLPTRLQGDTWSSFKQALLSMDVQVQSRNEGRTNEQTEWWIVRRVLGRLNPPGGFTDSVTLIHGDRPDFTLEIFNRIVGIEISEICSQNLGKAMALSERLGLPYDPQPFMEQGEPLSQKQVKSLMDGDYRGGFRGFEAERLLMREIKLAHRKKCEKVKNHRRSDEEWLFLYDNFSIPGTRFEEINKDLDAEFKNSDFCAVGIISGDMFFHWEPRGPIWRRLIECNFPPG